MGCVLGTPARAGVQRRRRREQREVATGEVNNAVRVRDKERHLHTGDFPGTLPALERRKPILDPCAVTQQGWPSWLMAVAGEAIGDWTPRRANTFEKLAKIGQGTYSNVYKARDLVTGKIVALKKVRFDNLEPESVKFMAREILVLRRLDHPNVVKLEGLVTSRMSCSLYLVFEYMEHDLAGLAAGQGVKFTEPQVKCFMKQLLSGLEHCHSRGVLHRDIKGSNLLIDNEGILRIADFGLATFFDPKIKQAMTSRVVTLWYRPPELLLGATLYGVGIDLWSAGCILAELLSGKPIMPGRTEYPPVVCNPSCSFPRVAFEALCTGSIFLYWKIYWEVLLDTPKLEKDRGFAFDNPDDRGTASGALNSEFFTTEPYACEPSSLPKYPPSKELDVKLRDEEARRQKALSGKASTVDGVKRGRARERGRAVPAPEANAEIQTNLDRWRVVTHANAKSKSEKFPPPHQDGAVGYLQDASNKGPVSLGPDTSFSSGIFNSKPSGPVRSHAGAGHHRGRKAKKEESQMASSWKFIRPFKPSTVGLSMDLLFRSK
ncbi:serine/threonine-protein kinase [Vigna angularis]|uniref:Serine/threonine-protein kinase n=1 Tax=Phaseolus angularis TaxID=3914 RepID=A0A8T0KJR8_PHAAN|nr:serine/threonine-protein kinase [Vigna angularis]